LLGFWAMIGKSNAVLLALLLALPTAFMATAFIAPAVGQTNYSAWLKIVTDSWDGSRYTIFGPAYTTPVNATGIDFPGRYNVTNVCVELYKFKNPGSASLAPLSSWEGPINAGSPNGTGFIRVSWPTSWENVTIIVKAKSYQGECIGAGNPFTGIIVYWLTVGGTTSFLQRFFASAVNNSYTVGDDGIIRTHTFTAPHKAFDFNVPAPFRAGPVDRMNITPPVFALAHSDPRNASVAHAAYIFKLFHEHTWYDVLDVLTYATIFIYDTDHTAASSTQSLIQAAITGPDGQSRYTREIYPRSQGLGPSGRFRDNMLVPIPLQTINRFNATPFHGGIGDPQDPAPARVSNIGAPHLNATKRVWWETVLVNQTLYVGREYNGTAGNEYATVAGTGKLRPLFGAYPSDLTLSPNTVTQGGITGVPAGPFSIALNNTVHLDVMTGGLWSTWDDTTNVRVNVADFNNNTVFYARFCTQDADMRIQHPQVGDKMVGAEITLNFKTSANVPYYLAHSIHTTGLDGCTNQPHKWPGYLAQYSNYARFPNGTNWSLRGSLNASYFFNPVDDASPVWRPGGYFERAWGGAWDGPYINAGRNWSALIPEITYMKTRQLSDDPRWGGFEVQVKWKGGSRNGYGGFPVLVDSVRIRNPYAIAATNTTNYNGWIMPNFSSFPHAGNNTVLIQIHNPASFTLTRKYGVGGPRPMEGPITLMLSSNIPLTIDLLNYDPATETFDIRVIGPADVDIRIYLLGNASVDEGGFIRLDPSTGQFDFTGVKASIKYHDAATNNYIIDSFNYYPGGWQDIGPDGIIESTDITSFYVTTTGETGAAEVEIWPGAPGTQTLKTLISSNNTDIYIGPIYEDFVGGMLFSGRPDTNNPVFATLYVTMRNALWLSNIADNKAPDIALFRTGLVYITADVHDIAYRLVDNLGNPVPAANTAVTLQRGNGGPITKSGVGGDPDFGAGGLLRSYIEHGDGWAVFYQLPEDQAYTVTVTFDGVPVGTATIDKLTHTVMEDLVLNIFKVKIYVVDCEDSPLSKEAFIKIIPPSGTPVVQQLDSTGALDFGYLPGGEIRIDSVWWKGVYVKFVSASIGSRSLPLTDGSLVVTVDSNIDAPIKLTALINDFIFTTWDFNKDNRIPRLNITLAWVGVHPLTGSRMHFLETMDPTGDTDSQPFNTTIRVSQFFNYSIKHFFGQISRSAGLKTYGDVRYIFYKMPSTYYNITVTTVTDPRYDQETQQTPGNSKWPGRTVPVDYEIKIDWTGHNSPPKVRKTPATVNDRVVLRVYMTWGGQPVTDPDLNPIGTATLYTTCGPVNIDLLTWAHTFWQRVVDGDFDYLRDARRIGNATYHIVNDNGVNMEQYIPSEGVFSSSFTSKWTEDTLLTTWLKADSQHSSNIWWNGTYRKQDLYFLSYVYPLQFTRGEEPWARFYNKVGLTGTGWETTVRKEANDPLAYVVNRFFNVTTPRSQNATWPRHNFTVVGTEGLWNQQKWRWEQAVSRGDVPEVPYQPYSLVIERPAQELVPVSQKGVLTVPIPVGFITLNLKDEDLARPVPYAVVQLDIHNRTSTTALGGRWAGYKYKVGREGNLTLLFPTQEMMENILSTTGGGPFGPYVRNYTLTVYWYLNSSIVYKDAFNLTKRGYNVEKVAIADVTFVLAISADKDRPVKDLYARIWWFNVSRTGTGAADTVFPGRITVDHARKTLTYTAVPETRGAAKWTEGKITLPWLPTSERFTKSDYDLVFDTATNRWVYRDVTRSWDIPFPTNNADTGVRHPGWPYQPTPTNYYEALNGTQNARIQYRISVWSDQLPIDPASPSYNNGAWLRDHYELVWRQPSYFGFAWMLFGHPPFDITFYRGPTGVGEFRPIPGYALTRTWERTPTPGSKTVAIKLNATDIEIPVFWQVGDRELGTYDCGPLLGYTVKGSIIPPAGATFGATTFERTTTAGTIRVGDKTINICLAAKPVGLVSLTSGDTPSTVIWGGSTLRITEVSPPSSIWADDGAGQDGADNPNKGTTSRYWLNWVKQAIDPLTGQPVNVKEGDQQRIPGVDLGIQYMGYGTPYEGRPREVTVQVFSNDPDNRAHRPFIKMFEFQNVSARITDFNGRALPGAFYQLIDAQTGKSAAWSYAGPDGRIIPMPIRKPGGVFIQRVTYLGFGPNGEPTWPVNSFTKWPVAYDSREDETTQETQKPDIPIGFTYTGEAGPWPTGDGWLRSNACTMVGDGVFNYTTRVLTDMASCPPAGWGRSFDVITRIFYLALRFVYGDAQRPADPAYTFKAPGITLPDEFTISGQGQLLEVKRVVRGTYEVVAKWPDANGVEVGRKTIDVSRSNVGTIEGTIVLALRDASFSVVDRQGRPLSGARVSVSPNLMRADDVQLRPDQIFTLLRIPDGRTYDFTIEWTSPFGTTAKAVVRETPAGLQARGSIVVPVDDISVKVVDFDGRPVAGAAIKFAGQDVGSTDSQGVIIVGQVPLDNDYTISVTKEGTEIGSDRVRFTASRTSATIQAGIYDITVLVKGAAGQPIQGALVELIKGGTTIARAATDASGTAVFTKLVGADYTVRAAYEQFSSTASLAKGTRSAQITLDLYTVLLGVPMTFATFLALIIGLILLVIVVVVIVSEYIRWRGRRLGIYPAAPPKK
jgi:hypothetical protein